MSRKWTPVPTGGALVGSLPINHSVMGVTKVLSMRLLRLFLKRSKQWLGACVSTPKIHPSVTVLTKVWKKMPPNQIENGTNFVFSIRLICPSYLQDAPLHVH